jgi:F0F1-type ATP synthase membrane subunit a
MSHWIKVFYSNQAVLDQRKMKLRFVIPLLFVLFLFISIPNFIGLYTQKTTYFLSKMENFASDYADMLAANSCAIDTTLTCTDASDHVWKGTSTTFHFFTDTTDKGSKNIVYLLKEGIIVYDKDGIFLTSGDYANFGKYDFAQIAKQVTDGGITKTDLAALFMRNVSLSLLDMKLTLIYFSIAFQYLIYVLVISFLFKYLGGRKEENKISFKQSFVMMVNLMLAPAMVCAAIGVFNPAAGSLLIPFAFVGRMIALYQGVIRKRLKIGTAEAVS